MPNPSQRDVWTKTFGALEPVADLGAARQRDRVHRARALRRVPASRPRAARCRGSRAARSGRACRTSAKARSSVAWSFCSISRPTASASGASGGIPGLLGRRHRTRRRRQLVEAVVDRGQLRRVMPGRLEEATHGVRDRDQPAGAAREGAVDVTERARAGSGRRCAGSRRSGRASSLGGDRAVDVGVDEVRVEEVGPFGSHSPDRRRAPSAGSTSEPAADAAGKGRRARRGARRSAARRCRARRGRGSVRRRRLHAAPGSSARRWPSDPLTPVSLWTCSTFTRQPRVDASRARRPCARSRTGRARRLRRRSAQLRPQLWVARELDQPLAPAPSMSPIGIEVAASRRRGRRSPVPPARVATTGRSAASASIATTGVPSFADVSRRRRTPRTRRRMCLLEADEPAAIGDAELGAPAPPPRARSSPSPTSTSTASTPVVDDARAASGRGRAGA